VFAKFLTFKCFALWLSVLFCGQRLCFRANSPREKPSLWIQISQIGFTEASQKRQLKSGGLLLSKTFCDFAFWPTLLQLQPIHPHNHSLPFSISPRNCQLPIEFPLICHQFGWPYRSFRHFPHSFYRSATH